MPCKKDMCIPGTDEAARDGSYLEVCMQKGTRTLAYDRPVYFNGEGSVVGQKEGEGPLGKLFDIVKDDPMAG